MESMNSKIKEALIKIEFVKRYEELSKTYDENRTPSNSRLVYVDGEEVMETIQDIGYTASFDSKEKFYKVQEEKEGNYLFGFNIIIQDGMVDLVWVVQNNDEVLLGEPWGTYSKRIDEKNSRIKKPIIGSYEDLEDVLRVAFCMYEDFKREISLYN